MQGTKEAVNAWNKIPNDARLKILNNVWCSNCRCSRSIGHALAQIINNDFLIKGTCISCGHNVVRYIEDIPIASNNLDPVLVDQENRRKLLFKLTSYPKNGKTHQMITDLPPLNLQPFGQWDLDEQELFPDGADAEDNEIYAEIISLGTRSCWEMEQILPGDIPDSPDEMDDPILQGITILEAHGFDAGIKYFKSLLKIDARCIDAYAHIGNAYFKLGGRRAIDRAKSYYKQGVAIGLISIGDHLNEVFPWSLIDNRPFLRCLEGFGLSFLEQGKTKEALAGVVNIWHLKP